ncbi:hypothetical protein AMIS_17800 [Actinoplanes missouriensis 431]|uniref:DUF1269 domain-containing protein n=1 Tax=Actinoplanes missouriensis (strain ATCC 14538 / DSM 43046 / CBS 188.64 / JCM 3121 / NBRC 102363 / NCIMB 12654 / NRRL B-3342 / UNCC 431) TaxID=512565 RepID=I0H1W3_ACTM4|nr:DUF1269 domain-containing protein [Actinoplanes missouriensis]BAL87000.1 hypothetical protein AMIS_17800 [Actinoplanes missouriensis 431]
MTTFTVWKFDDPDRAEQMSRILHDAAADGLVKIVDYTVVTWPEGAEKPETHHEHASSFRHAGWGAFWGFMIGSLFLVPVVGGVLGAGVGALDKSLQGTGIGRDELERIRTQITEGTSALFLVTTDGNLDRLGERFHGLHSKLIATNLTEGEEEILLQTFGDHTR